MTHTYSARPIKCVLKLGCIDFAFNLYEVGFKDIKVELSVRGDDPNTSTLVQTKIGKS
jgi:hypothetical protein